MTRGAVKPSANIYRVVIYCPDAHIIYDGNTPDRTGVGGGISARIHLASALARLGHSVTMYANTPAEDTIDGVQYRHFRDVREFHCDVFMAQSTGGDLDLSALAEMKIDSRLNVVRFGGKTLVRGWQSFNPAAVYTNSNFLRRVLVDEWRIPAGQVFVVYNGLDQDRFRSIERGAQVERDDFGLIFIGHPSKGYERAVQIMRELRKVDLRYHLDVYGGSALWGKPGHPLPLEPGVRNFGLVPQSALLEALYHYRYGLFIQGVQEGFGNAAQEARRAGVIAICTPVGAYPELFRHGRDAFLADEPYQSDRIVSKTTQLILALNEHQDYLEALSENARSVPWSWETTAATLSQHWDWILDRESSGVSESGDHCPECFARLFEMRDGLHCFGCGWYAPLPWYTNSEMPALQAYAKWVEEHHSLRSQAAPKTGLTGARVRHLVAGAARRMVRLARRRRGRDSNP